MPCTNCTDNQNIGFYPSTDGCVNCPSPCPDGCDVKDSSCILYTGPDLPCIQAPSNTNLEEIIQRIDAQVCGITGDYTGFEFACLTSTGPINNEKQFVERISAFVCQTRTDLDSFVGTTFPAATTNLQNQINALNAPGITSCSSVNILVGDNQKTVLTKLTNAVCSLYGAIDPSSANWNQCFTIVGAPPASIVEGFNMLISQICQIKSSGGGSLPTFDNTGSCLASPSSTDSLVDTVTKIKTRLCLTPTFNAGNLSTPACTQFYPADTLEIVISSILNQVDQVSLNSIRAVTSDFTLTNIDNAQPCLGKRLGLNLSNIDRKVALNNADLTPGTLFDKIAPGSNITLDFGIANAGKLTISSTASDSTDEKVKVNEFDTTAGYLLEKVIGSTDLVSVSVNPATAGSQLQISANLDYEALVNILIETISEDETLKSAFCTLISSCPSPCDPPTNVQIVPA
jgi:hypothetical protein